MNPTETFPHRRDDLDGHAHCRCGVMAVHDPKLGETWGRNCPAALREALAWQEDRHGTRAEQEREEADLAAEMAAVEAMSDDEINASLDAAGVDRALADRKCDALVRVCVERLNLVMRLEKAEKERDAERALADEFRWQRDAAHDQLADIAALVAGELPPDDRSGGDPVLGRAWEAVKSQREALVRECEAHTRCMGERNALRAHRELCSKNLLKGYSTGKEEARDAIGRLQERVAELEAILANERGEGQPPSEGWTVIRNPMLPGDPNGWFWERRFAMVYRDGARNGPWVANVYRPTEGVRVSRHFTARAAMHAADEALAARSAGGGAS